MNIAIIFASGKGTRINANYPKQFLEINGKPILIYTLEIFQKHNMIDKIYLSVLPEYIEYTKQLVKKYNIHKIAGIVCGGETSQDSIYFALKKAIEDNNPNDITLISDGVRPFISYETIKNNIESVEKYGSAITCVPCSETVLVKNNKIQDIEVTYRNCSFIAQAPQSFRLGDILNAHDEFRRTYSGYQDIFDSCTLFRKLDKKVHLIDGNDCNIKITTPNDIAMFRGLLDYSPNNELLI